MPTATRASEGSVTPFDPQDLRTWPGRPLARRCLLRATGALATLGAAGCTGVNGFVNGIVNGVRHSSMTFPRSTSSRTSLIARFASSGRPPTRSNGLAPDRWPRPQPEQHRGHRLRAHGLLHRRRARLCLARGGARAHAGHAALSEGVAAGAGQAHGRPQGLLLSLPRNGQRPALRRLRAVHRRHRIAAVRRTARAGFLRRRRCRGGADPPPGQRTHRARGLALGADAAAFDRAGLEARERLPALRLARLQRGGGRLPAGAWDTRHDRSMAARGRHGPRNSEPTGRRSTGSRG